MVCTEGRHADANYFGPEHALWPLVLARDWRRPTKAGFYGSGAEREDVTASLQRLPPFPETPKIAPMFREWTVGLLSGALLAVALFVAAYLLSHALI
jgi:hypothetical protein